MRGVFDDNFSYFSLKLYAVTPHLSCLDPMLPLTSHLNRLIALVQMRGHNICFL